MDEAEVTIERIGSRGDGVANTPGGPLYVPFALPGEVWRIPVDGFPPADEACVMPRRDRQEPICRHFGTCGGCVAQHMPTDVYLDWKRSTVAEALAQRRIVSDVAPCVATGPGTRRRAVLTAQKTKGRVILGYHRRASHDLVDIEMCPILAPAIENRIDALRSLVDLLLHGGDMLRLAVVSAREGLDVEVSDVDAASVAQASTRAQLARFAADQAFARLIVAGIEIFQRSQPTLSVGRAVVPIPPGIFLQASSVAEQVMAELVVECVGDAKTVADLFCGIGTFALRLAESSRVTAFDSDHAALDALEAGARTAAGLKPITTTRRDLFREPLSRVELRPFDAVVFDPPRAGAKAQAEMLAKSEIPSVVAVSCNPSTFARDARILIDGGYGLERVVPIDQFVFSEHVELVAAFHRPTPKRKASSNWRRRR